jgi:hypothetical protein
MIIIYTGYEGSKRSRRYRKMHRKRYYLNLEISLMNLRNEGAHIIKKLKSIRRTPKILLF